MSVLSLSPLGRLAAGLKLSQPLSGMLQQLLVVLTSFGCSGPEGCSYNGECDISSGSCACRAPWEGARCEVLRRLPVQASSGFQSPHDASLPEARVNVSSWGGSVVQDDDGMFHMYAAEMIGGCGIDYWEPNSRVVHAVAADPAGPFRYADQVLAPFAHEVRPPHPRATTPRAARARAPCFSLQAALTTLIDDLRP